jgi:glycosyltransferase involved in cell wall biosynthesis
MPDYFPVSLVIPTYNRGELVEKAIASALDQAHAFAEIVVVDDGSTDDTVARLERFNERITLIRSRRGGVQRARNLGVAACSTSYVALCDSDDLLRPEFTETLIRVLGDRPDIDIWYSNFTPFSGDHLQADKLASAPADFLEGAVHHTDYCIEIPDLLKRVLDFQPFFPTGSVIKKDFYLAIGGYDPQFNGVGGEDFEFLLRAIASGKLGYISRPLSFVRKHEGNDSRDTLRALKGEAQILEHALACHTGVESYRAAILASVNRRRREAFDIAYARGDFSAAKDTASHFTSAPTDSNFRIKNAISHFPPIMRDVAWRLSQAVH